METVRKTKTATASETDETVTEAENAAVEPVILESPVPQEMEQQTSQPEQITTTTPSETLQNLLNDAPVLFGNNPTAQEIEEFKQKESVWRAKLRNL